MKYPGILATVNEWLDFNIESVSQSKEFVTHEVFH
jgi:hypothetical protein